MYFSLFSTVETIKAEYRRLAKLFHPDTGGDTELMKTINAEYLAALKKADGQVSADENGKDHKYRFDEETEQEIMNKIYDLLKIKMDAEIYLIGRWIWIIGKTKPVKEALKAEGCFWHSKRLCWYWRPPDEKRNMYSKGDLSHLAGKYGVNTFNATEAGRGMTVN